MTVELPTLLEAKANAKALRQRLAAQGDAVSHAQALERLAHEYGFRDWNALNAAIRSNRPNGWIVGERVSGSYLGQPFVATVLSSEEVRSGWFRLTLDLLDAVDVVRFDSFSNYRKQIRVEIGPAGHSKEQTSDGKPHVQLTP